MLKELEYMKDGGRSLHRVSEEDLDDYLKLSPSRLCHLGTRYIDTYMTYR